MTDKAAVAWSRAKNCWTVVGDAAARKILRDPAFLSDISLFSMLDRLDQAGHNYPHLRALLASVLLFMNPPEHAPARRLLAQTLAHAGRTHGNTIAQTTLHATRLGSQFDLVADFARPVAWRTMAQILGITAAQAEALQAGSEQFVAIFDVTHAPRRYRAFDAIARSMVAFFSTAIAARTPAADADGIAFLMHQAGAGWTSTQLAGFCTFLFVVGLETVASSIAAAAHRLFAEPAAVAALRADPALLPATVEDLLRLHSAVQIVGRVATVEREVAGVAIPAGAIVFVTLAAANADPARYPAAGCPLTQQRAGAGHLAFGDGRHLCLGAALARAIVAESLAALLAEPALRIDHSGARWSERRLMRGLAQLPAAWQNQPA